MAAPFDVVDIGASSSIHFVLESEAQDHRYDAGQRQFAIGHVDCAKFRNSGDCFRAVGRELKFPAEDDPYWALNPNAFLDLLTDLQWLSDLAGVIVVLHQSDRLWRKWPYDAGTLIEVWLRAAESWAKNHIPLHLIFEISSEL